LSEPDARRDPGALVEPGGEAAAQIGNAEARYAAAERRHDRAEQHAEDADIGADRVRAEAGMRRGVRLQCAPARAHRREMQGHRCATDAGAAPPLIARVSMVASTDMPGRTRVPSEGLGSSAILTGTRCTTLVKLPVALSGGSSAKVLPVPGDQLSTWPVRSRSGNASTKTRAVSPGRILVIWVSL